MLSLIKMNQLRLQFFFLLFIGSLPIIFTLYSDWKNWPAELKSETAAELYERQSRSKLEHLSPAEVLFSMI